MPATWPRYAATESRLARSKARNFHNRNDDPDREMSSGVFQPRYSVCHLRDFVLPPNEGVGFLPCQFAAMTTCRRAESHEVGCARS